MGGTMELSKFRLQQHLSAQHYVGRGSANTSIATTVELIAEHFSAPMVQVNVVTAEDQVTIAAIGGPLGVRPRVDSFCTNVVSEGRVTFLSDIPVIPARLEHIKAYLGVPLTGREGLVIGALCLLDTTPRDFPPGEVEKLQRMAEVVQDQLELMRRLGAVPYGPTGKAAELNNAVQDGQIVPFYQPIVDLATGDIRAVEALARWQHPTRGLLAPEEFIPLAEDSDIIIDLDLSVLRQAAIQLGRWQSRHPKLRLSVNLSARHFDHAECVRRLVHSVEVAGNDPASVTLELTETARLASNPGDQGLPACIAQAGIPGRAGRLRVRLRLDGTDPPATGRRHQARSHADLGPGDALWRRGGPSPGRVGPGSTPDHGHRGYRTRSPGRPGAP